jgi:hypothetical protein
MRIGILYVCLLTIDPLGSNPRPHAAEANQLLQAVIHLKRTMQDRLQMKGFSMTPCLSVFNFRPLVAEDGHPSILP